MPDEIRVHVVDYGRTFFQLRYIDPATGKPVTKSSKCRTRKEAERAAARWEEEIKAGIWKADGRMPWAQFRVLYRKHHLANVRQTTADKIEGVLDVFERTMRPATIGVISAETIGDYQNALRAGEIPDSFGKIDGERREEATITGHTAHLKAALRWCVDFGYLRSMPRLRLPGRKRAKKAKPMKGRPITDAEFAAYLKAIPTVVGEKNAPEWVRYARGLWASGLRLDESLTLSWDDRSCLMVDMTRRRPVLHVPGDVEKGGEDRVLPIAPEFAAFLEETPEGSRHGPVFTFPKRKNRQSKDGGINLQWVSRVMSDIGREAGIVVDHKTGKFASAHDLRRSFGERWAMKVLPQVLMELMRHSDISTTLRYYVGQNAERTADVLWATLETPSSGDLRGNTSGNTKTNSRRKSKRP